MDNDKLTIRKLTERECMRLMAFTDEEIDRLKDAVDDRGKPMFSATAIYKFAGNSVVVDCYKHILGEIIAADREAPRKIPVTLDDWCARMEGTDDE